jgi:hypothetical protein
LTSSTAWILSTSSATALDAHCVPFIARLIEADNADLVSLKVQTYAEQAMAELEWKSVTKDKPTLWDVYLRDHLIPSMEKKKLVNKDA